MPFKSVAVLGTGALGGYYGGLLAQSGADVHFLLRSDYEHVKEHGLRVDSTQGNFHLRSPQIYGSPEDLPPVDLAVVCWKSTVSMGPLQKALEHCCRPDSVVLVLQNGLNVERQASEVVGAENVLGGCAFLCSNKIGPGHIHHLDYGAIAFGEFCDSLRGSVSPRMLQIKELFDRAGIDMRASPDLQQVRWKKLAWNIPFNGLSVVLNADTKQIMDDAQSSKLARDLMLEVQAAARTDGIEVPDQHIEKMLDDTKAMVPYDSSMRVDFVQRRPMEVEAIFGNPVRAAQARGYRPHKIEMLYEQLCCIDRLNRKSS